MHKLIGSLFLIFLVLPLFACSQRTSNTDLLIDHTWYNSDIIEVGKEYNTENESVYICDCDYADDDYFIMRYYIKNNEDETDIHIRHVLYYITGDKLGEVVSDPADSIGYFTHSQNKWFGIKNNSLCLVDFKEGYIKNLTNQGFNAEEQVDTINTIDNIIYIGYWVDEENHEKDGIKAFSSDGTLIWDIKTNNPCEQISPSSEKGILNILYRDRKADKVGFYTIDQKSGSFLYNYDSPGFNLDHQAYFFLSGDISYYADYHNDGIYSYDLKTGSSSPIFDYNNCYVNYNILYNAPLVYASESILIKREISISAIGNPYQDSTNMIILHKSDSDPTQGKVNLSAAVLNIPDKRDGEAVVAFNEGTDEYRIIFDPRYRRERFYDQTNEIAEVDVLATDTLKQDILAGTGPDLILDTDGFTGLDSTDYLKDLSFISQSKWYNDIPLFDNIVDDFKRPDGTLLKIPLCAGIMGISARISDAGDNIKGFTFDSYATFIKEKLKEKDPIAKLYNRMEYTDLLVSANDSLFVNPDGTYVLGDDYRKIISLARSNADDEISSSYGPSSTQIVYIYNIYGYVIDHLYSKSLKLYGLPSNAEHGPSVYTDDSVSYTVCLQNDDLISDFTKILLSDKIQELNTATPINRTAYEATAREAVDSAIRNMESEGLPINVPENIISLFSEVIRSCDSKITGNAALSLISKEELPAYFKGDKSIDDVIPIIENRCNTMIRERKK